MPAATAASTPATLSSTTTQACGSAPIWRAARGLRRAEEVRIEVMQQIDQRERVAQAVGLAAGSNTQPTGQRIQRPGHTDHRHKLGLKGRDNARIERVGKAGRQATPMAL